MPAYTKTVKSDFGTLHLAATERHVIALGWSRRDLSHLSPEARLEERDTDLLSEAAGQLQEYLSGERKAFKLPFAAQGTAFQEKVWSELAKIPYGAQLSYQALAERIGNPAATRAVGSANGKNPLCIFVPCHRVVRASGSPGGYSGGEALKIKLLALEARG